MKKLILGLMLISVSQITMAQDVPLQQHIALTQDTIDKLVSNLFNRTSASGLSLKDYSAWDANFKVEMEQNIIQFEDKLKLRIFGPLQVIVGRYMKTYEDKNLTFDQKTSLLDSLLVQFEMLKPSLEKDYWNILNDLYFSHNLLPKYLILHYFDESGNEIDNPEYNKFTKVEMKYHKSSKEDELLKLPSFLLSRNPDIYLGEVSGYSYFIKPYKSQQPKEWKVHNGFGVGNISEVFSNYRGDGALLKNFPYNITHKRIIQGCNSKSCIVLKTSDVAYFFQIVKSLIDKDIKITLPYPIEIQKIKSTTKNQVVNTETTKDVVIKSANFPTKQYQDILKRVDYSPEVENLEFDVR